MTKQEAIEQLWEAAIGNWKPIPQSELLSQGSLALPGSPIKGKDLYRIGVALGLIEEVEFYVELVT